MTSALEIFDAEIKKRQDKERGALLARYSNTVTRLEEEGIDVFTPTLTHEDMPYRQDVIFTLKKLGWRMTHWAVVTHGNAVYAYPVFEKEPS